MVGVSMAAESTTMWALRMCSQGSWQFTGNMFGGFWQLGCMTGESFPNTKILGFCVYNLQIMTLLDLYLKTCLISSKKLPDESPKIMEEVM